MTVPIAHPLWSAFVLAAVAAAVFTPVVIRLANRWGAVSRPRPDRWHQRTTAFLGGIAIYLAAFTAALITLSHQGELSTATRTQILGLGAAATAVFFLGLADDLYGLRTGSGLSPSVKLVGQTVAACLLIVSGVRITSVAQDWLAIPLTIFWVVGVTNAINLLDNMDGIVAGVVGIAALAMAAGAAALGAFDVAVLALCLSGACAGFLCFNFHPARIFMGDCGSLFLGFTISALALVGSHRLASNLVAALLVPVAVLAIPIFDTTLVTIARVRAGRPVSQGGRDHTAHRLVALGLSERGVALLLYGSTALLCATVWVAAAFPPPAVLALAALMLLGLGLLGVYLGMVHVYEEGADSAPRGAPLGASRRALRAPRTLLPGRWVGKRPLARVMLDVALVVNAFALAHLLRFEAAVPEPVLRRALSLLPLWIAIKLVAMLAARTHLGLWRYAGAADVLLTLKGSTFGSLALVGLVTIGGGFQDLSRSVLILDWLIFTALALTARVGCVLLDHLFGALPQRGAERVVVVGADASGVAVVRQLRGSRDRVPVGFLDPDESKHRFTLAGLPVLGGLEDLPRLKEERAIQSVVIALAAPAAARVAALCIRHGIPYTFWPADAPVSSQHPGSARPSPALLPGQRGRRSA